jgi:hypothetical protein
MHGSSFSFEQSACLSSQLNSHAPLPLLLSSVVALLGFTAHPSAAVQAPGTYLGLIEKLDYLKELGVNAIELLPVSSSVCAHAVFCWWL